MGINEFIVMACLVMNGGTECQVNLTKCVNAKREAKIHEFAKVSEDKKVKAFDMLTTVPNVDYGQVLLECAKGMKK